MNLHLYFSQSIPRGQALVGFSIAIFGQALAYQKVIETARSEVKRMAELNNRVVNKAWPYLPNDVKNEINEEIKFSNIVAHER